MGRACSICTHENRDAIDNAVVAGVPYRNVTERFGGVSISAISRHRKDHISPALLVLAAGVAETQATEHGLDLLSQLRNLHARVLRILEGAETDGKPATALAAVREARGLLELTAKMTGELDERPVTVINLQASAEWQELRGLILGALRPHPAALAAVVAAINGTGQAAIGA